MSSKRPRVATPPTPPPPPVPKRPLSFTSSDSSDDSTTDEEAEDSDSSYGWYDKKQGNHHPHRPKPFTTEPEITPASISTIPLKSAHQLLTSIADQHPDAKPLISKMLVDLALNPPKPPPLPDLGHHRQKLVQLLAEGSRLPLRQRLKYVKGPIDYIPVAVEAILTECKETSTFPMRLAAVNTLMGMVEAVLECGEIEITKTVILWRGAETLGEGIQKVLRSMARHREARAARKAGVQDKLCELADYFKYEDESEARLYYDVANILAPYDG